MTTTLHIIDTITEASMTWTLDQHRDDIRDWITAQYPDLDGIQEMSETLANALARNVRAVEGHRPGWSDMPGYSADGLEPLDFLGLDTRIEMD